jgi:hypothetical protein
MSLMRRIEAIERRRATAGMISPVEVSAVKQTLYRKLGLSPQFTDVDSVPISRKSLAAARGTAIQRLRIFLDSRGA